MNTVYLLFFAVFLGFYAVLLLVLLFANRFDQKNRVLNELEEDHYKDELFHFKA